MTSVSVENPEGLGRTEILDLYDSVGWSAYTRQPDILLQALAGSHRIVTARNDDGILVGIARAISDGASIVYVQDILVQPEWQRAGVGRRLVETLLETYEGVRQQVLLTDAEAGQRAFYESLGFIEAHDKIPELRGFIRG